MEIKIGDTRKIELLDAIRDSLKENIKIGNNYAELTSDISKTKGTPLLKFEKEGDIKYIREKFITSGTWGNVSISTDQKIDITSYFQGFNSNTKINRLTSNKGDLIGTQTFTNLGTSDFSHEIYTTLIGFATVVAVVIERYKGTIFLSCYGGNNTISGLNGEFTIE